MPHGWTIPKMSPSTKACHATPKATSSRRSWDWDGSTTTNNSNMNIITDMICPIEKDLNAKDSSEYKRDSTKSEKEVALIAFNKNPVSRKEFQTAIEQLREDIYNEGKHTRKYIKENYLKAADQQAAEEPDSPLELVGAMKNDMTDKQEKGVLTWLEEHPNKAKLAL
eukprot:1658201-Heterocapsa_arctica.AAC.1